MHRLHELTDMLEWVWYHSLWYAHVASCPECIGKGRLCKYDEDICSNVLMELADPTNLAKHAGVCLYLPSKQKDSKRPLLYIHFWLMSQPSSGCWKTLWAMHCVDLSIFVTTFPIFMSSLRPSSLSPWKCFFEAQLFKSLLLPIFLLHKNQ